MRSLRSRLRIFRLLWSENYSACFRNHHHPRRPLIATSPMMAFSRRPQLGPIMNALISVRTIQAISVIGRVLKSNRRANIPETMQRAPKTAMAAPKSGISPVNKANPTTKCEMPMRNTISPEIFAAYVALALSLTGSQNPHRGSRCFVECSVIKFV